MFKAPNRNNQILYQEPNKNEKITLRRNTAGHFMKPVKTLRRRGSFKIKKHQHFTSMMNNDNDVQIDFEEPGENFNRPSQENMAFNETVDKAREDRPASINSMLQNSLGYHAHSKSMNTITPRNSNTSNHPIVLSRRHMLLNAHIQKKPTRKMFRQK